MLFSGLQGFCGAYGDFAKESESARRKEVWTFVDKTVRLILFLSNHFKSNAKSRTIHLKVCHRT